jgi:hypothetical protein
MGLFLFAFASECAVVPIQVTLRRTLCIGSGKNDATIFSRRTNRHKYYDVRLVEALTSVEHWRVTVNDFHRAKTVLNPPPTTRVCGTLYLDLPSLALRGRN